MEEELKCGGRQEVGFPMTHGYNPLPTHAYKLSVCLIPYQCDVIVYYI